MSLVSKVKHTDIILHQPKRAGILSICRIGVSATETIDMKCDVTYCSLLALLPLFGCPPIDSAF